MTTTVERRRVAGVPCLLAVPDLPRPLPLAFWFHGFDADKDVHRPELERLAAAGFVAVAPDAVGHGERRHADLDARVAAPREQALATARELALATAREVPALVAALAAEGLADGSRVAAVGVSMGGYLAYRLLVDAPVVHTVVALLGSPEWPDAASPHRRPGDFRDVALLSITGERDENVPPGPARDFHAALAAGHPRPARARYVELAGAPHLMGADDWARAMDEAVAWLERHARDAPVNATLVSDAPERRRRDPTPVTP